MAQAPHPVSGQSLKRDLRGVLLSLCCAGGGLLGLWRGMLAVPTDPASTHVLEALGDVMQHVAVAVGLGVAVGAAVGTLVCAAIPWLRPWRG